MYQRTSIGSLYSAEVQGGLNLPTCKKARFHDGSADVGWHSCNSVTQLPSYMICDLFADMPQPRPDSELKSESSEPVKFVETLNMSPSLAFELDMLSCSRHIYWLDVISSPISHCMTETYFPLQ